eukprot:9653867-Alexandrium_andersonii.AAC.2
MVLLREACGQPRAWLRPRRRRVCECCLLFWVDPVTREERALRNLSCLRRQASPTTAVVGEPCLRDQLSFLPAVPRY